MTGTDPANRRPLRAVSSDHLAPASVDDVQREGDHLARELRKQILRALATTMRTPDSFEPKWKLGNIRAIRHQARETIAAWQVVEASCGEIIRLTERPHKETTDD